MMLQSDTVDVEAGDSMDNDSDEGVKATKCRTIEVNNNTEFAVAKLRCKV